MEETAINCRLASLIRELDLVSYRSISVTARCYVLRWSRNSAHTSLTQSTRMARFQSTTSGCWISLKWRRLGYHLFSRSRRTSNSCVPISSGFLLTVTFVIVLPSPGEQSIFLLNEELFELYLELDFTASLLVEQAVALSHEFLFDEVLLKFLLDIFEENLSANIGLNSTSNSKSSLC